MIEKLKKFAELAVKTGVNLQKNQLLVITSPTECYEFARLVTEEAYKIGAKDVIVTWKDEIVTKEKFLHAADEVFEKIPNWEVESKNSYAKDGAAFINIYAEDPTLLKDCNPERIGKYSKLRNEAFKELDKRIMGNQNRWCVISIPTKSWAKKVFPNESEEVAVEKLWNSIFIATRIDLENPIKAWAEHNKTLNEKVQILNNKNFKYLYFKNNIGTDVKIELVENHLWCGGGDKDVNGIYFNPNMPTEEIFTMPKKTGVNGVVVNSKPLTFNGNIVDKFKLTFKDGKVVDFSAEVGYETLKNLLDTDDGSKYLGEVALVPYNSPIAKSGTLFYNMLFDENAACHLAFGEAYPSCVKNGEKLSDAEKEKVGYNNSLNHEDFMIGTADMSIIGETFNGEKIEIFKNGNWEI